MDRCAELITEAETKCQMTGSVDKVSMPLAVAVASLMKGIFSCSWWVWFRYYSCLSNTNLGSTWTPRPVAFHPVLLSLVDCFWYHLSSFFSLIYPIFGPKTERVVISTTVSRASTYVLCSSQVTYMWLIVVSEFICKSLSAYADPHLKKYHRILYATP